MFLSRIEPPASQLMLDHKKWKVVRIWTINRAANCKSWAADIIVYQAKRRTTFNAYQLLTECYTIVAVLDALSCDFRNIYFLRVCRCKYLSVTKLSPPPSFKYAVQLLQKCWLRLHSWLETRTQMLFIFLYIFILCH